MRGRARETARPTHSENDEIRLPLCSILQDLLGDRAPLDRKSRLAPEFGLRRHEVPQELRRRRQEFLGMHNIAPLWFRDDMYKRQMRLKLLRY